MKRTIKYFLIIELILYITFLTLDFTKHYAITTPIKYTSIILCFIFSLYCCYNNGNKLIPFALVFTILADYLLLVVNNYYIFGLISFFIAQMIYMVILINRTHQSLWILRIVLPIIIMMVLSFINMFDLINILSVIYFSQLLINTIISWMNCKHIRFIFAIGLTLFVCCDICVGLFNITDMGFIYEFTRIGMWLFYLPSQILIVLSGISSLN